MTPAQDLLFRPHSKLSAAIGSLRQIDGKPHLDMAPDNLAEDLVAVQNLDFVADPDFHGSADSEDRQIHYVRHYHSRLGLHSHSHCTSPAAQGRVAADTRRVFLSQYQLITLQEKIATGFDSAPHSYGVVSNRESCVRNRAFVHRSAA